MNRFMLLGLMSAMILITGCHHPRPLVPRSQLNTLGDQINQLIDDPNLARAQVGVYIESADDHRVIYRRNEHKLFMPASNLKLFTTAAVLTHFTPEFRYTTRFYPMAEDDKLSLVIQAAGDPTWEPTFHEEGVVHLLENWADSLTAAGINQIDGDLVADLSYFQTYPLGWGWQWDDEPYYFSAQISALSFNVNTIDVTITPADSIGKAPNVTMKPENQYMTVVNHAVTAPADSVSSLSVTRIRGENILLLENQLPVNRKKVTRSLTMEQPALYFLSVFADVLKRKGISVNGELAINTVPGRYDYNGVRPVITHKSPELGEIIKVTNKRSDNLYTEQILVTLAAEYGSEPTADAGTEVVTRMVESFGGTRNEFRMYDGSGLSRMNLISPLSAATLLRKMYHHKYFDTYRESLPISGTDGTISSRMRGTVAEGKVFAKTGTLTYARNLSGYVTGADGKEYIFSLLFNNFTVPTANISMIQDRICILLANYRAED